MTTKVMPVAASCHIHMDVIVAMADPTNRPGGVVSSGGRLLGMHGVSLPHKDLTILAKPAGVICFHATGLSGGVFTHWVKTFGAPVFWLEAVGVFTV